MYIQYSFNRKMVIATLKLRKKTDKPPYSFTRKMTIYLSREPSRKEKAAILFMLARKLRVLKKSNQLRPHGQF